MSKIVNEPKIKNKFVVKIRELLEHRALSLGGRSRKPDVVTKRL